MKQPQLGKKISELRLAKGLTQTELAEKCNLSLRTIQRIESTEVTPRSHTLKLIFKILDFNGFNSSIKSEDSISLKKRIVSAILLIITTSIISISIFKLISSSKNQPTKEVTGIIQKSQSNIKRWMNSKQVDSVLTMFSDNACILNTICGKTKIRKRMNDNINNGYQILEYNTIAISVSNTIVVEKYEKTYKYKGNTLKEKGIIEWQLINREWLITNDLYSDEGSSTIKRIFYNDKDDNSLIILQ